MQTLTIQIVNFGILILLNIFEMNINFFFILFKYTNYSIFKIESLDLLHILLYVHLTDILSPYTEAD